MSDIVTLVPKNKAPANEVEDSRSVEDCITSLLELHKQVRFESVFVFGITDENDVVAGWTIEDPLRMVGAVEAAKQIYLQENEEFEEDS